MWRVDQLRRWVVPAWALLLGLLMLGPALAPGYVLTYDMVWVPDLALRSDFLGVGSSLPRAVPSDAVIAALDEVVPGALLQKAVLLSTLVGAGTGMAALVVHFSADARPGLWQQCLAASVAIWNPFVVERLVIGHWPVLIGYAALPWLLLAARRHRQGGRPHGLLVLLPLASLSASAGLASAVSVLAAGVGRRRGRRNLLLVALVLAANAPWVLSGLLHAGEAVSDPAGARAFAARGEGMLNVPLTALGLGGIWNAEVVPVTREGVLGVAWLVFLLTLAGAGIRPWWRTAAGRDAVVLLGLWALGFGLVMLGWVAPGAVAGLAEQVPGGGLLRDSSRLLGLCMPLVAMLVARGSTQVTGWLRDSDQRRFVAAALVLVPLAVMPDAGWGASGRLSSTEYPASYDAAREAVGNGRGDDVLLLPFSSYRAPTWNDGRNVLDPVGRYLRPNFVASDELIVSGRAIAGEDPRGEEVRAALSASTADRRSERLLALGIGWAVTDLDAPGDSLSLAGETVSSVGELHTVRLGQAAADPVPGRWWVLMGIAWFAFLLPVVGWLTLLVRHFLGRTASRIR